MNTTNNIKTAKNLNELCRALNKVAADDLDDVLGGGGEIPTFGGADASDDHSVISWDVNNVLLINDDCGEGEMFCVVSRQDWSDEDCE
jgi:hypothetical protein